VVPRNGLDDSGRERLSESRIDNEKPPDKPTNAIRGMKNLDSGNRIFGRLKTGVGCPWAGKFPRNKGLDLPYWDLSREIEKVSRKSGIRGV
jgi:hypothetical protein